MRYIPTEILLAVGKLIDGPSLVACLQVSWNWHIALLPRVWGTIDKKDWVHRAFFLRYWNPFFSLTANTRVDRYLGQTRSLTWHNNPALLATRTVAIVPTQLRTKYLSSILQKTVNLSRFSLVMATNGIDKYVLSDIFYCLQQLSHLSELEIDMPLQGSVGTPIGKYFPLFAKLETLRIAGDWYSGFNILEPAPTIIPWILQHLSIDHFDVPFFRFCPDLQHLILQPSINGRKNPESLAVREMVVEQLQGLSRLDTLIFNDYPGWRERPGKFVKVEGNETQWTRVSLYSRQQNARVFTLRDIFGLTQA